MPRHGRPYGEPRSHASMRALIHEKLARFGVSGPGREWLLRALHPASEDPSPGLPDQSATPVLRPAFRVNATIQPPAELSNGLWDCFMWIPPGDVNALYWATGPSGTNFAGSIPPVGAEVGVIRLQSSSIYNPSNPYPLTFGVREDQAVTSLADISTNGFRHQYKSVTVHLNAADVANQGQIYAAQFSPILRYNSGVVPSGYDSGIPIPGTDPVVNYSLVAGRYSCVLPASEDDLTAMAPDFYMNVAKEGCYMPMRLSGPAQHFARTVPLGTVYESGGGAGVWSQDPCAFPMGAVMAPTSNVPIGVGSSNSPWVYRIATENMPPNIAVTLPTPLMFDTGYDNTNVGVMIFRGLQGGGGGGGGGFGASLQVKVLAGLEVAPNPESSSRVFAEPAVPYEPRALEAYYTLCLELLDAYPASFNSLESILDAIGSAASKVWNVFEPALTKVAPVLVDGAVSALMHGGLTGARRGEPRRAALIAPRSGSTRSRASSVASRTTKKPSRRAPKTPVVFVRRS
jgi:hypothetical protein